MGELLSSRYDLGDVLGFGGMSEVRVATDTVLQREVAIKILRPDLARDPTFLTRFRNEARNSARLNHPNIVSVYDTSEQFTPDGVISYIVMEMIHGQTLRDIVHEDGALYPQRAMHIMADVCGALHYSHKMGIIHRDVKPGNIMITDDGAIKVMDFGISRVITSPSDVTHTAEVMGTAQYLSPEQARGKTVDHRSDIYSAGCVLYETITGQPPFEGESPLSVAYQHVQETVVPPSALNPAVTPQLDAVVLKALCKDPNDRYQTAAEMQADLVTVLHGQTPVAMLTPMDGDTTVQPVLTDAALDMMANDVDPKTAAGVGASVGTDAGAGAGVGAGATTIAEMMAAAAASGKAADKSVSTEIKDSTATYRKPIKETGLRLGTQRRPSIPDTTGVLPIPAAGGAAGTGGPVSPAGYFTGTAPHDYPGVANPQSRASSSRHHLRKALIAFAILLGVALAGTVATEAITGVSLFASQVAVADVTNMKAEEATQRLRNQGFDVNLVAEPSNTVPRGMVARSEPSAATMVARGGLITLIVSSGKGPIQVPDVRGLKVKDAREKLTLAGLKVAKESRRIPSEPDLAGKVVRLSEPVGAEVSPNQEIVMLVGTGDSSLFIPATHGLTADQARNNLEDAGFKVSVRWVDSPEPRGTVIGTSPREKAKKGDTVTMLVSRGNQRVMPNVRGMNADAAEKKLRENGWNGQLSVVPVITKNVAQAGTVADQEPAPGQPVSNDEEIVLHVYQLQVF